MPPVIVETTYSNEYDSTTGTISTHKYKNMNVSFSLKTEYVSAFMLNISERGGDLAVPNPGVAYIDSDSKVLYNGNGSQPVRFLITSTGNSFTWEEFGITEDIYHELENLATSEGKLIEDVGVKFEIGGFSGMAKEVAVCRLTGDLEFYLNFYCPGPRKFDTYYFTIYWRYNGSVQKYVRVHYDSGIT